MTFLDYIGLIFAYFIILYIFRIITIFAIFKCIINIKVKITNNLKEKMEGMKKWKMVLNVNFVVENFQD
jgi:hypothetical protein